MRTVDFVQARLKSDLLMSNVNRMNDYKKKTVSMCIWAPDSCLRETGKNDERTL